MPLARFNYIKMILNCKVLNEEEATHARCTHDKIVTNWVDLKYMTNTFQLKNKFYLSPLDLLNDMNSELANNEITRYDKFTSTPLSDHHSKVTLNCYGVTERQINQFISFPDELRGIFGISDAQAVSQGIQVKNFAVLNNEESFALATVPKIVHILSDVSRDIHFNENSLPIIGTVTVRPDSYGILNVYHAPPRIEFVDLKRSYINDVSISFCDGDGNNVSFLDGCAVTVDLVFQRKMAASEHGQLPFT